MEPEDDIIKEVLPQYKAPVTSRQGKPLETKELVKQLPEKMFIKTCER